MNALTTGGLEGRTALFVGAGSTGGIGFATATAMAAAGARVAIADMASTDVMSLGAEPPGEGHTAHTVDVTDRPSVDRLVAEVGATGVDHRRQARHHIGVVAGEVRRLPHVGDEVEQEPDFLGPLAH
ncbi:MAG: SDR family oxidoreductase, partial [Geminicoccaceae bacterium]|nr:SDR family oxidoreductase [Geminicoccaceae bacterium]